ncbi:hypothetical protein BC833DRAFT_584132 [Globomyces pollinis-pini]|nr:hypothetical protein BC833DRAFT_584132 [Globomyces pollinis-pini]
MTIIDIHDSYSSEESDLFSTSNSYDHPIFRISKLLSEIDFDTDRNFLADILSSITIHDMIDLLKCKEQELNNVKANLRTSRECAKDLSHNIKMLLREKELDRNSNTFNEDSCQTHRKLIDQLKCMEKELESVKLKNNELVAQLKQRECKIGGI